MPISDLCDKKLISVERGATLQYAAQLMKTHNVGGIVVVETNGHKVPVGILTDRDIVLNVVAENRSLNTKVSDIMSTNVVRVKESEGIASVVDTMEREGVRRVVIADSAGQACGLVSADDIIQLVARELYGLGNLVKKQVQNEAPVRLHQQVLLS